MTTVKLTRIGSAVIDNVPLEKFNSAVKRANLIDDIIIINDIPYKYSSVEFNSSGGGLVTQMINVGSITFADLNAASGATFVPKTFLNAKPVGKMIVRNYIKLKTPFVGAGAPAPVNVQFLATTFYNPPNPPMPNVAGFIQTTPTTYSVITPLNSSDVADIKLQLTVANNIPTGNPYTAGELECYIEVADIPASVYTPVIV